MLKFKFRIFIEKHKEINELKGMVSFDPNITIIICYFYKSKLKQDIKTAFKM